MINQLLDSELENKQWDYIVRNVNYKKYIDYEERKRNYETCLLLKDLNNWSISIFTQILNDNNINENYLKEKLEYFIKRL